MLIIFVRLYSFVSNIVVHCVLQGICDSSEIITKKCDECLFFDKLCHMCKTMADVLKAKHTLLCIDLSKQAICMVACMLVQIWSESILIT